MTSRKTLVLGLMPQDEEPQHSLAAGPWCFSGQENRFPDWEKKWHFAPEPLATPDKLPLAAKAAITLCLKTIPKLAAILSPESHKFPTVYWQTLLMPWAMEASRQIVDRCLRAHAMVKAWGQMPLDVPVLPPDCQFEFADEHDFTLRGSLGIEFNHWLFSILLDEFWPASWKKIVLPPVTLSCPVQKPRNGILSGLRNLARMLSLRLPFPRLKGLGISQAFLFSIALLHKSRTSDHSIDLSRTFMDVEALEAIPLPDNVLSLFLSCLPKSLKCLRHDLPGLPKRHSRLRVASITAYEDTALRQKYALWRARGNRLAYAQHGANYGQVKTVCDAQVVEYCQDAFFTWGWTTHGNARGNFIPLPYPQLTRIADAWTPPGNGEIIFVGTEMAMWSYQLDSRPTPLQFLEYREDKGAFFAAIDKNIIGYCRYRPYFPLPGTLNDEQWLTERFPDLKICRGPLLPQLLRCRLLTLDHPGTTMLEAFAANIPMVLYWNRKAWPFTKECEKLLDMLASCGIWQPTPQDAARKVNQVWKDTESWWQSEPIQTARRTYCEHQARITPRNAIASWLHILRNL